MDRPLVFSALQRELARDRDDLVARHAGDLLGPGRRVGHVVVVGSCRHSRRRGRGRGRSWRRTGRTPWPPAPRRRQVARAWPARCGSARRGDRCRRSARARGCRNRGSRPATMLVLDVAQRQPQLGLAARRPPSPRGSTCPSRPSGSRPSRCGTTISPEVSSIGDRLPFRVVGLAQPASRSRTRAATAPARAGRPASPAAPASACRCTGGSSPRNTRACRSRWNSLQDHVAHRHRERRVGALLRRQPDVGELRRLGVVRADHRRSWRRL